ncbi:LLM class flavin-dependent oxidoreductase [Planococcus sp. ISL-109]|uniref:LLM class flavin-dependent oxidoreductase n=1 Tax=Planococcus sp. ISL-109 TaxID=2819166 RepID=UPI001BEB6E23|nr:LLM class flavin-dependent oxidoreductase [Planococcus sp. ISL-109]MBT2581429.1 LLM class flavin-dependent oxidoreductase [Planococcus sp. ISL-109]
MTQQAQGLTVSVLDLVPVRQGHTVHQAFEDMKQLAQHAEQLGYKRFWLSEHHNTPTLASSATSILISKVLEATDTIEVGSGGIMLPNHTPLVVAEQFGTLETMHPGRVNLGLGRAPGTDMQTARALRRTTQETAFQFPEDIEELQRYLGPIEEQHAVKAHPGVGTEVPLFILGSSTSSAVLAAKLGLPYAFAAHFAPQQLESALAIYRSRFEPSEKWAEPYIIACVNVVAAESAEEAEQLATSGEQFYLNVVRGTKNPLMPPVDTMDGRWSHAEEAMVNSMARYTFKGDMEQLSEEISRFAGRLQIDELMAVSYIYDQDKRKRSYEILKEAASNAIRLP